MTRQSRTEKKKILTQELIINVTIELVDKQGYDETTMEQIAGVADIAKGTLYNYYSCKEEIISAYIKRSFEKENEKRIKEIEKLKSTNDRLFFLFDQLLNGVKRRKDLFEKYLIYQMKQLVSFQKDKVNESGIGSPIGAIIEYGQASEELRSDLSVGILTEFIQFVFIELVKLYYSDPEGFNQEASINKCINLFISGASNPSKEV